MKMVMVESGSRPRFLRAVNEELEAIGPRLFSVKVQRNLYYSLSGSTHKPRESVRETSSLKEGYVAFIVYDEAGRGRLARAFLNLLLKGGRRK